MNRRGFFKLAAGGAAVAFVGIETSEALPIFRGDGKHDDTKALQAAIDGQPFEDQSINGLTVNVSAGSMAVLVGGGLMRVTDTLHLGRGPIHTIDFGGADLPGPAFPRDRPVFDLSFSRHRSAKLTG